MYVNFQLLKALWHKVSTELSVPLVICIYCLLFGFVFLKEMFKYRMSFYRSNSWAFGDEVKFIIIELRMCLFRNQLCGVLNGLQLKSIRLFGTQSRPLLVLENQILCVSAHGQQSWAMLRDFSAARKGQNTHLKVLSLSTAEIPVNAV